MDEPWGNGRKERLFEDYRTIVADGTVCGIIPIRRKAELAKYQDYHGITILVSTYSQMKKYQPRELKKILEKEAAAGVD